MTVAGRTLLILSTYNEAANLEPLVRRIDEQGLDLDIVVIDDNSPDGTGRVAERIDRRPPVTVIHREQKMGLGSAHKLGFAYAIEHDYELAITMDTDFAHPPRYLPSMIEAAARADVVVGSRYLEGGDFHKVGVLRPLISHLSHWLTRQLLGLPYDCTGGFRLYRVAALRQLDFGRIPADGHALLIEILHALSREGFTIVEIPIVIEARPAGESKVSLGEFVGAIGSMVRLVVRCRRS